MLLGATVGVGEGSTEASCEFSSLFVPSNEGAYKKNLRRWGRAVQTHSGWEKCGHWRKFTAAMKKHI